MTKHQALHELSAVLRETPVALPRVESGPAPLSPAQKYLNSNPMLAGRSNSSSSLFSQLVQATTGLGGVQSGSSLFDALLSRQTGGQGGGLAGFGLAPIVSGLLGLFGGGKSAPPPLPLYWAPQRIHAQAGIQGGVVTGADSNQSGMPRANAAFSQPQITLNIQAMDTQSIMNRSTDIAQAVRQAMLQSHPINDVVADL